MADPKLKSIPKETLRLMHQLIKPLLNNTNNVDAGFPIKPAFWYNYGFFSFIYGLLGCFGICFNVYFLIVTVRAKLYKSTLHCFLMHIAFVSVLKCLLVLPISLVVLLSRFWMFGNFMCYAVIVLQDFPSRLSLLSFVLIAMHRYRQFAYNSLHTFPKYFAVVAVWALSLCLSLPACVFVQFYDIGQLFRNKSLRNVGLCVVNNHKMEEYARAMFIVLYVIPWAIIAFAFTRISIELSSKRDQGPLYYTRSSVDVYCDDSLGLTNTSGESMDVETQIRVQKFLTLSVGSVFVLTLPLNSMFLIQFAVEEDDSSKSAKFDLLYAVLVWISFISEITTPTLCLVMRRAKVFQLIESLCKNGDKFTYYKRRLSSLAMSALQRSATEMTTLTTTGTV